MSRSRETQHHGNDPNAHTSIRTHNVHVLNIHACLHKHTDTYTLSTSTHAFIHSHVHTHILTHAHHLTHIHMHANHIHTCTFILKSTHRHPKYPSTPKQHKLPSPLFPSRECMCEHLSQLSCRVCCTLACLVRRDVLGFSCPRYVYLNGLFHHWNAQNRYSISILSMAVVVAQNADCLL